MEKKCNKCNLLKDINQFQIDKKRKDGLTYSCKSYLKEYRNNYYIINKEVIKSKNKEYYKENKESIDKYKENWYLDNKDNILQKTKDNYFTNRDSKIEYQKIYSNKNKDILREYYSKYSKEKRENDILYNISCKIRNSIRNSIRNFGHSKKIGTHVILGCSFEDFKLHLESKFDSWMTWENRGLYNGELNYGWDIDHIIPLSSAITEDDIIRLNHYTNLQPLCSYINRYIKKDKLNYENISLL